MRKLIAAAPIGRVILAGAGPGGVDLVTVKLLEYLKSADVILTDRLVSPELLEIYPKEKANIVYVGKQCAKGIYTSQSEICRLMKSYALQGKLVLRLKGGDASLFSNILDELSVLKESGIPYEIVPGVSAAFGAAAYAGIPLTARGYSKGVRLLTLVDLESIDAGSWQEWARTDDTLVFYMSGRKVKKLAERLIEADISSQKGLAVITQATTPNQHVSVYSFQQLRIEKLPRFQFLPTLIMVGYTVPLHDSFAWFESSRVQECYFDANKNNYQHVI